MNYPGGYFTLLKNGKRIYSRYTQFTGGEFNYTQFLISADNGITIQPNKNIKYFNVFVRPRLRRIFNSCTRGYFK